MTPEVEFNVGDEVEHRTGGQKMIYTGESQLGEAICEWFDGRRRYQETFAFIALKKYEKPVTALSGPSIYVV